MLEEQGDKVKIAFNTWSSKYDEWVPRQSERLRLALPGDKDVEAATPFVNSTDPVQDSKPPMLRNNKPFVPKPYNPEKEFQKRQMRLREKIAEMQKAKFGQVDPALQALQDAQPSLLSGRSAGGTSQQADAQTGTDLSKAQNQGGQAETAKALDKIVTLAAAPQGAVPIAATAQFAPPPPVRTPAAAPALPPSVALPAGASPQVATQQAAPPTTASTATTHPTCADPPKASILEVKSKVRWHELLTAGKEHYYHEVSTGRTQWELPSQGWVALLAEDGSRYYWEPEANITQWDSPDE